MSLILFLACASPEPPPPACPLWFTDLDGDGYGTGSGVSSCEPLSGRSLEEGDCDDRDGSTFPGAMDPALDGVDQDCDGEDTCAGATQVDTVDEVDCELGLFDVSGHVNRWPEGDCICSVEDLSLSAEEARKLSGTLTVVRGTLELGLDAPWDGRGLEGLRSVELASIQLSGDATLPMLQELGELQVWTDDANSSFQATALVQAGDIFVSGDVDVLLPALRLAGKVQLQLAGNQLQAPKLEQAEFLTVHLVETDLPRLRHVTEVSVGPETSLDLPAVELLEHLWMMGHIRAPRLSTVSALSLYGSPSFELPALHEIGTIFYNKGLEPGLAELPDLHSVGRIQLDTEMTLVVSNLGQLDALYLRNAVLDAPLLSSLGSLETVGEAELYAPLLHSITEMEIREGQLTLQNPERLVNVESLTASGDVALPELRSLGILRVQSGAQVFLPELSYLDELSATSALSLPKLRSISSGLTMSGPLDLPALESVGSLYVRECGELPSLRSVEGPVEALCLLDLRAIQSFGSPLVLVANPSGEVLLPDPFLGSIWIEARHGFGGLQLETVDGALSISHELEDGLSGDTAVQAVGGQLFLSLFEATSLGNLTQVHSVGKDLTYCAPLIPDAEIQDWLTTLSVGGEVVNRCP